MTLPEHAPERRPSRRRIRLLLLALLVGLLGLAAWGIHWWVDEGRHLFHPKNWGVVEPDGLWRSGQIHGDIVEDVLRDHEVDLVIDLAAHEHPKADDEAQQAAIARLGIEYLPVEGLRGDGTGVASTYADTLVALLRARRAGKRVLVHCEGGSERTGVIVALHRLLLDDWSPDAVWEEYLSYRRDPPETPAVARFVNRHIEAIAARLVAEGLLEAPPDPVPRLPVDE